MTPPQAGREGAEAASVFTERRRRREAADRGGPQLGQATWPTEVRRALDCFAESRRRLRTRHRAEEQVMAVWIRRENCPECAGKWSGGCMGHWVEGNPFGNTASGNVGSFAVMPRLPEDERKQRLERVATAVLAGMGEVVYSENPRVVPLAIKAAKALIAAIDKEPTDA